MNQGSKTAANPEVSILDESDLDSELKEAVKQHPQLHSLAAQKGESPVIKHSKLDVLKVILGIAVVASAGFLAYSGFHNLPSASSSSSKKSSVAPPVVTVSLVEARRMPVNETIGVTGTISSWDELKVGCEVGGLHVSDIFVEEGERVKKGQVLATLHSELLEAQLEQAEARLKSAQATMVKSVQPNRPEDIAALKAAVDQAESNVLQEKAHLGQAKVNFDSAELNVPRYENLAKLGAVSVVEAETKRFARDTAKLEMESATEKVTAAQHAAAQAKHRYALAAKGGRNEDVQITKASIDEIKAQIRHLKEQLKQTKILAEDDGLILQRNVHIGDTSEISKPFFVMSRLNRLELKAQVNDTDLKKFKPGQEVVISSTEKDQSKVVGHVRLESPIVDPTSRMGTVRIELPSNTDFKPGMFVRGEICVSKHDGLVLPISCLVTRGGESVVFTLDGKLAQSTTVSTGMETKDTVEITSGLKEGQLVIDKGARFISDRDLVEVAK